MERVITRLKLTKEDTKDWNCLLSPGKDKGFLSER